MSFLLRRRAARVMLIDEHQRILLIKTHNPSKPAAPSWWELPGGGIDPGEASEACCARELREEAGVAGAVIGPVVFTQHVQFEFAGLQFDQDEVIHIARCGDDVIEVPTALEALEALAFEELRWWSRSELDDPDIRTLPGKLGDLLDGLDARFKLSGAELAETTLFSGDEAPLAVDITGRPGPA